VPNGPSAQAGLQQGDIITSINGSTVTSTDQLEATTISEPPGTQVTVEYQRNGSSQTTKVTLGEQP
jgi:S1-C subfamily serine protease